MADWEGIELHFDWPSYSRLYWATPIPAATTECISVEATPTTSITSTQPNLPNFQILPSRPVHETSWGLYEILAYDTPMGWEEVFKKTQDEGGFTVPAERLRRDIAERQRIVPNLSDLFGIFHRIRPEQVRVVILLQDPYPQLIMNDIPRATGAALECRRGDQVAMSLKNIYKKIAEEIPDFIIPEHGDLSMWISQGVMMLNDCLSCIADNSGSHGKIWITFIVNVLEHIASLRASTPGKRLIVVPFGNAAKGTIQSIKGKIEVIEGAHPSGFSYARFKQNNYFRPINQFLQKMGDPEINWQIL